MKNLIVCVAAAALCGAAFASGGSKVEPPPAAAEKTPEQQAAEQYNAGLASRDEAWQLETKADEPGLSPDKRAKLEKRIHGAYADAVRSLERAADANPRIHEAWGALGYARRQTGDHEGALEAYNLALSLKPDYTQAIEYLGEAYLGLDRIGDARATWERLQPIDEKLAGELLGAMHAWIAARRAEPRDVKVGELDAFERWVAERLHGEPPPSTLHKSRSW